MPKLSKGELAIHRAWLSDWRTSADMAAYVRAVNAAMGASSFFCQGGVEFLRDAWLAAQFSRLRQGQSVRLIPAREQWPDFEVRHSAYLVERVECAEADLPGRRRGDEYRNAEAKAATGNSGLRNDPVDDWIERANKVPIALRAVVATKIRKRYAGYASLLIYLNITEFGIRQTEIEAAMMPAITPALACFERVWILWKDRLYGPWIGKGRTSKAN